MKRIALFLTLAAFAAMPAAGQSTPGCHEVKIPSIDGYVILKGDMHVHTIFSDATVWPATRVDEAVLDGLDFIAITDHVEGRHMKMVNSGLFNADRDESYKIAAKQGKSKGIMVLHGGELTNQLMPPGHFNATFLSSAEKFGQAIDSKPKNSIESCLVGLKEAKSQGAFIVWNHPNWSRQAPNETIWHPIHTTIYDDGMMNGIEIFNQWDGFCPEAFHWAVEKNLTIVAGTDVHCPMANWIDYTNGEKRPLTLIFAKEKSLDGIKEALVARRTAVVARDNVYGAEEFISPLADKIIEVKKVTYSSDKKIVLTLHNCSDIPVVLRKAPGYENFGYTRDIVIGPGADYTQNVSMAKWGDVFDVKSFEIGFNVMNFHTDIDVHPVFTVSFDRPEGK